MLRNNHEIISVIQIPMMKVVDFEKCPSTERLVSEVSEQAIVSQEIFT